MSGVHDDVCDGRGDSVPGVWVEFRLSVQVDAGRDESGGSNQRVGTGWLVVGGRRFRYDSCVSRRLR